MTTYTTLCFGFLLFHLVFLAMDKRGSFILTVVSLYINTVQGHSPIHADAPVMFLLGSDIMNSPPTTRCLASSGSNFSTGVEGIIKPSMYVHRVFLLVYFAILSVLPLPFIYFLHFTYNCNFNLTSTPTSSPLATISFFSVSMGKFLFCLVIWFLGGFFFGGGVHV